MKAFSWHTSAIFSPGFGYKVEDGEPWEFSDHYRPNMKGGYNRKESHLFNRTPEGAIEKEERKWMRRHHIPQPEFYNIYTGTWHYPIVCSGCGRRVGFGSKDKPVKGCFIDGLRICPDCHPEFYSETAKAERRKKSEEIKLRVMKELKNGSDC